MRFIVGVCRENPDLQIMYGIGGETDLSEKTLDHLDGYMDSKPVRIGNGAYDQRQTTSGVRFWIPSTCTPKRWGGAREPRPTES